MNPVFAYVDPSVMTYTIQAVAGAIIALGAVIGVTWRIMKKKLKKPSKSTKTRRKKSRRTFRSLRIIQLKTSRLIRGSDNLDKSVQSR